MRRAFAIILLLAAGCAATTAPAAEPVRGVAATPFSARAATSVEVPEWPDAPPAGVALPANALAVPLVRQSTDYSCGAAALLAVLFYWQAFDGGESDLYEPLETSEDHGTEPRKIVEVAASFGLEAKLRTNLAIGDLRASLARGETVILDIQAWRDPERTPSWKEAWDDGHYVVLVGMDTRHAYVMDPSSSAGYAYLPLDELVDRWRDYETRSGRRVEYVRAGMSILGKRHIRRVPGPLWRLE
jgi:uncharacterized protein